MKHLLAAFVLSVSMLFSLNGNAADTPVSCSGSVITWNDVQKGRLTSEIEIAFNYYMDPRTNEGTFEERREKLNVVVRNVFKKFISERTKEYNSVRCHYRGIDWNQGGRSSWKTLICQPGFKFDRNSLKRTMNGDWKGGPNYSNNDTQMSWRTGGHRRSETFAELDAVYAGIEKRVIDELNSARKVLHEKGIPTDLP